jgi:signal transduction histidine kinase
MEKRKLKFDPGALAIIQMGEELIGSPSTALAELVKNAYDADALECTIYIHPVQYNSFIIIYDNGTGMDEDILFGEWLQPSISSKRKGNKKSNVFQRPFLGSKGIGRLAAMSLGQHLTVISKTSKEKTYNWVSVDREEFKKENLLLSKINFPGGIVKDYNEVLEDDELRKNKGNSNVEFLLRVLKKLGVQKFNEGTLILIEGIDNSIKSLIEEEIEDADLDFADSKLLRSLRSLVTPLALIEKSQASLKNKNIISQNYFNKQTDDSFLVKYGVSLYDEATKGIENIHLEEVKPIKLLSLYNYRVIGKVLSDGTVTGYYYCKRLTDDSYSEKFNIDSNFVWSDEVLRKRRKDYDEEEIPSEIINSEVNELFFDIRVYDRDNDVIDFLEEKLKLKGRLETRRFLDSLVGLRIAKNGFSVKPYGEEEKDWMELGQMRVQDPSKNIGPNQLIGYVFLLSPQNDGLKEKTNREGFFENKAFVDLKKIIRAIMIQMGRRRYNYRLKHNLGRTVKSKIGRPDTKEFFNYLSNHVSNQTIITRTQKIITDFTTALDSMEYTLSFSQRLATLGSGLELVYHELTQPLQQLGGVKASLDLNVKNVIFSYKDQFQKSLSIYDSALDILEELKKSLMPAIGLSRPKTFSPASTFKKVCRLFQKDIVDFDININIDKNIDLYLIKDYEYSLWVSFLNIVNNAVYWLKTVEINREIRIFLENKDHIIIENNGPEIDEEYIDLIFEYGVTGKKEKNATGLGLSFTKNILTSYDWSIKAENRKYGPAFILFKIK